MSTSNKYVMTCKCGIIDLGHVRHAMDRALQFYYELQRADASNLGMAPKGSILTGVEDGWLFQTSKFTLIGDVPRTSFASQAVDFALKEGEQHEDNFKPLPGDIGKGSYYTPEDLPSNKFGADIAGEIISGYGNARYAPSSEEWLRAIHEKLILKLTACVPLTKAEADKVWSQNREAYLSRGAHKSYDPVNITCDVCTQKTGGGQ